MSCNRGAAVLPDDEFWLHLQCLSDNDPFPGNASRASDLSSPSGSLVGSAKDSDNEENFIADLTRKVAHSTLEDDFTPHNLMGLYLSGSPKSTLCGACGCGHASDGGSPNGVAQMKTVHPPTLDVLYQAAGKVANMRLSQQQQIARAQYLQQQRRLNNLIYLHNSKSDVSFYHNQASSQFSHQLGLGKSVSFEKADTVTSSSAWPTLQQGQQRRRVQGSAISSGGTVGMRAVFLGSSDGNSRGSSGTGVFLPRQAGVAAEPKEKQGCPTVLIPAKVVQALNLTLDEMNPQQLYSSSNQARLAPVVDGDWRKLQNGRHLRQPQQRVESIRIQAALHPEISLPSEWTY